MTSTATPEHGATHRRRGRSALVIGLIVVAALVVLVGGLFIVQQAVQPADRSSFYTPPTTLPSRPGSVIRTQRVDAGPAGTDVWRVLHTSTGGDGRPTAVSGVVVAPEGDAPKGGWPIVAWAHGTTGIASRCAPSLDADGGVSRIPEVAGLVAAGNVVVATDYPGLGTPGPHPYLVGTSEGRSVLDSIRAARTFLGARTKGQSVVYGHSQGGHATLFTAALAPTYAPDVHLVGAAAMAPPTALGVLMERDIREPAGLVLTALALSSWSRLYPQADEAAVTHPVARPFVANVGGQCVLEGTGGTLAEAPDVIALRASFLSADPATTPGWSELLAASSPSSTTKLAVPVLVAQGLSDTLVRPDVTAAWVAGQCAAGADLEYDTYPGVDHFGVRTASAPSVAAWMEARLAGRPAAPGCHDVTRTAPG